MAGSECHMPPGSVHGAGLSGGEERSRFARALGTVRRQFQGQERSAGNTGLSQFTVTSPGARQCLSAMVSTGTLRVFLASEDRLWEWGSPGSSPLPSLTIGFEFFEASAKDNINVKQTFERLVDVICEKMSESLDTADPAVTGAKQGPQLTDQQAPPHQDCAC